LFAGLFSGSLFILSKRIYRIYTSNIITYNQIYGPLSIIPIFLLWLYLIWFIVLLGAVISYVLHHRSGLKYILNREKINQGLRDLIPTAILLILYKNYRNKDNQGVSFALLMEKINLPAEDIKAAIENLKVMNIIAETEAGNYLPLNEARSVSVWDLYQSNFLADKLEIKNIFQDQEMQSLYLKIKNREKESFKDIKFVDFLN
ncbi:MAG: membrane protein, partial [Halanaerobium sp.]